MQLIPFDFLWAQSNFYQINLLVWKELARSHTLCLTSGRFYSVTLRGVNEIYMCTSKRTKMHCTFSLFPASRLPLITIWAITVSRSWNVFWKEHSKSRFLPQIILIYGPESARNTTCNLNFVLNRYADYNPTPLFSRNNTFKLTCFRVCPLLSSKCLLKTPLPQMAMQLSLYPSANSTPTR